MASFEDRWARLKQKRPALCDDSTEVVFQVENLRSLLKSFYDAGGKDWQGVVDTLKGSDRGRSDVEDLLRRFGM